VIGSAARLAPPVVMVLLLVPGWASAQGIAHGAHVSRTLERPLHTRVAVCDSAAIATVDSVGMGRIHLSDAVPVLGRVPASFELKRAPSNPPPWVVGERALLLLRGARSPYIAVDEPHEMRSLEDAAAEERWSGGLRALQAADSSTDPSVLRDLYVAWLSQPGRDLRRSALVALGDVDAPFQPLPEAVLQRLGETAVAAAAPADLRSAAARSLVTSERGREVLLARVPGPGADPEILLFAFRAAAFGDPPGLREAVARAMSHPEAAIRRASLRAGGITVRDAGLRARVERMAREDPDRQVSQTARELLERAGRAAGS
jgi:hypothetical protein